jgi:hypothetical protein
MARCHAEGFGLAEIAEHFSIDEFKVKKKVKEDGTGEEVERTLDGVHVVFPKGRSPRDERRADVSGRVEDLVHAGGHGAHHLLALAPRRGAAGRRRALT